jgi:multicomponent Na+:H+ antiporter subunit G
VKLLLLMLGVMLMMVGTGFVAIAAVGVVRLADVYLRSHAASKAATLGACLTLLGAAIALGHLGALARAALAIGFLLATIPVATQLLLRAARRGGIEPTQETSIESDHQTPTR